jgi:hypothetical protein
MSGIFNGWFGNSNERTIIQLPETNDINTTNDISPDRRQIFSNPFSSVKFNFIGNPLSLGADDNENEIGLNNNDNSFFNLSYFERISLFIVCIIGSFCCFTICFVFFPFMLLHPKKFTLLWSIGSILFLIAFMILNGIEKFLKHLLSIERLPFTIAFVGCIVANLLFSLIWKHNLLVIICCILQIIISIVYAVSYFPYGRQGLRLTTGVARSQVEGWLNF